jgi:hypothetical protein
MCLLIAQRPGAPTLSEQHIRTAWQNNSDGAGYAFLSGDAVIVRKPFFKLKPFMAAYLADHAAHGAASPFLVHFRFATHGGLSDGNTHPHHQSNGAVAVGHNGVLSCFESPHKNESDTAFFCRTVLAHRHPAQVMDAAFATDFLGPLITASNKLVFLSTYAPHLSIVNEKQGSWDGEHTWFSNNTHVTKRWSGANWDCEDDDAPVAKGSSLGFSAHSHHKGTKAISLYQRRTELKEAAYDTVIGVPPTVDLSKLDEKEWRYFCECVDDIRDDLELPTAAGLEMQAVAELERVGIAITPELREYAEANDEEYAALSNYDDLADDADDADSNDTRADRL